MWSRGLTAWALLVCLATATGAAASRSIKEASVGGGDPANELLPVCPTGCFTCDPSNTAVCFWCDEEAGYTLIAATCLLPDEIVAGCTAYDANRLCTECDAADGYMPTPVKNTCIACSETWAHCEACSDQDHTGEVSVTIQAGCTRCSTGFELAEGTCVIPVDNCEEYTSEGCSRCQAGFGLSNGVCTICPSGYASDGNSECAPCPPGTYTTRSAGSTTCTACPAGQYYDGDGVEEMSLFICKECPIHTYSAEGSTWCKSCPNGTHCPSGGCSTCTTKQGQPQQEEQRQGNANVGTSG